MRRKFGILFLIGITVLAGTQEAARQFDGLKSSLNNFTRASLWSGLIVYAQPVSDGKLPTPQIYYLMPPPQRPAAPAAQQQQPVLADNGNGNGATAAKFDARNNHGEEAVAQQSADVSMLAAATREIEDAAKSELALNKLPLNLIASHFDAPKPAPRPDRVRVYDEVAKNETLAVRKFKHDADVTARSFVRELDVEKLVAEAERIEAAHGQLEHLKLKTLAETANLRRRVELRIARRPPARPERHERFKAVVPFIETRAVTLSDISSVGCEKTITAPKVAPVPAAAPIAPVAETNAQAIIESLIELGMPAPAHATSNSWTLNCDTEPEQK